ncbi:hypothetical protein SEPCBS119000_003691 [Sporothrix epigloea]|uniref:TFIIIC transcription initiation factor complex subunits Tfc3 n=1 Tax=Sporothrix epigloea TaxID=1892477 RepID=A0ABP0DN13_9PEZI
MTKGLDELIERLVADIAYCGETGLSVGDFIRLVSRLHKQPQQKSELNEESLCAHDATDAPIDMPLARKAWEWLTSRPEILVGRDGSRGKLSLDDALALPEPQMPAPNEDGEPGEDGIVAAGKGAAKKASQKGAKPDAPLSAATKQEKQLSSRGPKSGAKKKAASDAASGTAPESRPRLYVTERTLWFTLTGHEVDYKKIPLLEWRCLQGIASTRRKGILQADLRELVNQDKRSVPKRTDFLTAKGYIVKRTTIARGYRTSMMWLTEFAPIELPDGDEPPKPAANTNSFKASASEAAADSSLLSPKDLASSGIDFSPEFLKQNLEPVPWRNRWLGDAIEFASFGQTVLAIVKAWGVMRVVDLKIKLGIMGKRWQMRTLARICREFSASGVLRYVAAMHPDEQKMFRDCIKFERDPTPGEWKIYLAAGRRRTPAIDVHAKNKKAQDQKRSRTTGSGIGIADDDGASLLDPSLDQSLLDFAALEGEEEDEFNEGGMGGAFGSSFLAGASRTNAVSSPAWACDIPLVNLIFDTVDRSGIDGITSPEICRATLGTAFARYVFTLTMAMARPGTQPAHLQKFQLHCEPTRVGKNNAYLFRTLENAKLAERLSSGESLDDIEQQSMAASAAKHADAKLFWDLSHRGVLQDLSPDELRRLYGFEALPTEPTAEEIEQWRESRRVVAEVPKRRGPGRPRKVLASDADDRKCRDADDTVPLQDDEPDVSMQDNEAGASLQNTEIVAKVPGPPPPKRKFGRRPKPKAVVDKAGAGMGDDGAEENTTSTNGVGDQVAEPVPMVRLGEPGSLNPHPRSQGRPRRSAVIIFQLDELRDPDFLSDQKGYKHGAPRMALEDEVEPEDETVLVQTGDERLEAGPQDEAGCSVLESLAADLKPVTASYNGKLGHLVFDLASKSLHFTPTPARRARSVVKPKEPISIPVADLVSEPVLRTAPDGDGQALILETLEGKNDGPLNDTEPEDGDDSERKVAQIADGITTSFVFILDEDAEDNTRHAAALRECFVASRSQPAEDEQNGDDDNSQPARRRGRRPGTGKKKKRLRQETAKTAADGSEQYVCETCSGVWKNFYGLRYHQTKARTACNPNYEPATLEGKLGRRKKQLEMEEQSVDGSEADAEPSSLAQTRGRRGLRPRKLPIVPERDDSPVSVASSRSMSPALSASEAESSTSLESPSRRKNHQRLDLRDNRLAPAFQLALSEDSDSDNEKLSAPRGIAGAMRAALVSRREPSPASLESPPLTDGPLDRVNSPSPMQEVASIATPYKSTGDIDMSATSRGNSANSQHGIHTPASGYNAYPQPPASIESASGAATYAEPIPSLQQVEHIAAPPPLPADGTPARGTGRGAAGFWMPPLPKSTTSKLSPFVVRSLIVMEITKYLVDYFGGVFPSDRSLWYAAFHIYTRSFPGEDPPTLKATKAAVKKLELGKEVEEHTFGFRDPKGQFIYCRLLVRPGTDILQSETAADFKRQVQAAYPQPFVPDGFAPSEKDLAILRILDKDIERISKRSAKGRRPLAPEIEVLNAPFYEHLPQAPRPVPKTVLLLGSDQGGKIEEETDRLIGRNERDERNEGVEPQNEQQRPSNIKRKDLAGGASTQGASKRRRTRFADEITSYEPTEKTNDDSGPSGEADAAGSGRNGSNVASDDEADIDPALRTVKTMAKSTPKTPKPTKTHKPVAAGNPGLDSLPASFFVPDAALLSQGKGKRPIQHRDDAADGFATFVHFLPPNMLLEDERDAPQEELINFGDAGQELARTAAERVKPRQFKFVTKTHELHDMGDKSPRAWPIITETTFQRQSDASFTMDGFMPTRKALLRANLPQTPLECAAMLRGNQKVLGSEDTPEGQFLRDLEKCRSWELSQVGADILSQPSVAPGYVFLSVPFPGVHFTAEMGEAEAAGVRVGKAGAISPLRWTAKSQYTVETIPYGKLDTDETDVDVGSLLASTAPVQRKKTMGSNTGGVHVEANSNTVAVREQQLQQAKYSAQSRREMTAYPQTPADFLQLDAEEQIEGLQTQGRGKVDWSSNDTLIAAFVVIKTLLGGLNQAVDWGLMMRLFPGKQLSTLRTFWTNTRRDRQAHIDTLTERFQQAFLSAYSKHELPPIDFNNVLAYDWPWLISWALPHLTLRHKGTPTILPATREALWGDDGDNILTELPPMRTTGWREDFFGVTRSVWNRLQDSASEAAALSLDRPLSMVPEEGMAPGANDSVDRLRNMVARSWIRALCGTPYQRYPPSKIKQKLLTLGSIGATETGGGKGEKLGESATNNLLQTVISNLTNDRVLRRAKSLMSLGGRMYTLTDAYESTVEKMAAEAKLLQAYKFKDVLDATFRGGRLESLEIPLESNDDGMVMAILNMQAHGRITLEAVDAPYVPLGFEPGNYESRKFPKQYQRFRLRIKPTAEYIFNDHQDLEHTFDRIGRAWHVGEPDDILGRSGRELDDAPPKQGPNQEMPIWRDFFGVLDSGWFARLTGAVLFSLATRGATPVKQTTAHLRPIVESFEVQMIEDWATRLGFLTGSEACGENQGRSSSGSRMVTEWWWLLVGHMYQSVKGRCVE